MPEKIIKRQPGDLFGGTFWIDETNNRILKVRLAVKKSVVHPFTPIGANSIAGADMEITRSYEDVDGAAYLSSVDFNYRVAYVDSSGQQLEATITANGCRPQRVVLPIRC